jgi:MFS family permease
VALEHREYRLLFFSTIAAQFGDQIQTFANLWQIYAITGSALHLGLNGLARAVPVILFSLAGGVIADRVDRKKIIVFTQLAGGAVALSLCVLSATGLIQVWHIYAATFLNATLTSAGAPARRAVIASLVPRRHLVNALALNTSVNQIDRIVAPSLAGILIVVVGLPSTYGLNAIARLSTTIALLFISLGVLPERPQRSPLRDLLDGLAFVRMRSVILALLSVDLVGSLFGNFRALLPVVAGQFDSGPTGFGFLSSAPAVGSLIGVSIIMYLGDFHYKGRLMMGAILVYAGALATLGLAPWFWLALLAAGVLGMTDSMQATTRNGAIQMMTPDQLRGRVTAFGQMLQGGGPALGQSFMGAIASAVGASAALVGGAIVCAGIIASIFVARPDLRARDLGTAEEPEPLGDARPVEVG